MNIMIIWPTRLRYLLVKYNHAERDLEFPVINSSDSRRMDVAQSYKTTTITQNIRISYCILEVVPPIASFQ